MLMIDIIINNNFKFSVMAVNRMDKSAHFYSTGKRNNWCSQKQLWTILIFVLMLLNLAYSSSICKKNNIGKE